MLWKPRPILARRGSFTLPAPTRQVEHHQVPNHRLRERRGAVFEDFLEPRPMAGLPGRYIEAEGVIDARPYRRRQVARIIRRPLAHALHSPSSSIATNVVRP